MEIGAAPGGRHRLSSHQPQGNQIMNTTLTTRLASFGFAALAASAANMVELILEYAPDR